MNTISADVIEAFVSQKRLAIAGVSRSGRKFGNSILNELTAKGYELFPVHPEADVIGGRACSRSLADLPEQVGAVIVVVNPTHALDVVRDAHAAGITRVWLQQGAQSDEAVAYCRENGMEVVTGHCIMMFAEPVESFHKFHRFLKRLFGGLPKKATA